MPERHPPLYRPGTSEHSIPDRFAWVDTIGPWIIFLIGILIMGATVWRVMS